jgi:hypothetical protein
MKTHSTHTSHTSHTSYLLVTPLLICATPIVSSFPSFGGVPRRGGVVAIPSIQNSRRALRRAPDIAAPQCGIHPPILPIRPIRPIIPQQKPLPTTPNKR